MTGLPHELRAYSSREDLAQALASTVAGALESAIADRGVAILAVSGGSTPGRFFDALSRQPIDWSKVVVTLVDERFVPETDQRSNAALVKSRLLVDNAAAARFLPLYRQVASVEEAAEVASAALAGLQLPIDVAILGMGTDGHTASFFPDARNLETLLKPNNEALVLPVHAETAGEPRLTLTLARLLDVRFVALHIEGDEKRAVLETALAPGRRLPVSALFIHSREPVSVYWAG